MDTVGAYEAKTHFSQLLERVSKGEVITITRHHTPIARLQPVEPHPSLPTEEVIERLKALRRRYRLEGLSIEETKKWGRA